MSPTSAQPCCPPPDGLRRLLAQSVPGPEAAALRHHLEECPACREAYRALRADTPPENAGSPPNQDTGHYDIPETRSRPAPALFPFLEPPDDPADLGRLGIYRITGVLGEGGMGVVFDAQDTHLQRRVALKVMKPALASNLTFRQRFLQEARAAAAVPHDNIVTLYQVGMVNDVPFLAMQYLAGESLEQRLNRAGPLPVPEVLRIGREIAEGLAAAHEQGLVHRDIKPANVWLERDRDRVKILDFGLARASNDASHLTATGMIVGTPSYLSPEQARGLVVDGRSDLFSLGCLMYRALTGVLPFRGSDTLALLTALALDEPTAVTELAPNVPAGLRDLIRQLLAKSPADRPTDARAVADRLRAIERGDPDAVDPPAAHREPSRPRRPPPQRRRRRWALAGALLVLLVAGGVWGLRKRPKQPAAAPSGEPIQVGVLFSLSGTLAESGSPVADATLLAVEELNRQGGLLGRPVQPVVVDGASDWREFARLSEQLLTRDRVAVTFGCWTSACRKTVRPIFEKHGGLLFYPVQYEGLEQSPSIVYLGASPNQQILPALQYAVGILRKRRLFLVGSDYVFPRTANAIVRDALAQDTEVQIVGEEYRPLGCPEWDEAVKKIADSGADLIVNTINGDSNAAFFRALRRAGVSPERVPTLSFSVGENELRSLTARRTVGDYAAWNYFQSVDRVENAAFVRNFRARYGPLRVLSDPMESAYSGVHLWARAVRAAGTTDAAAVRRALPGQTYAAPGGPLRIDPENQHAWKVVRVGRIVEGGQFEIVWSSEKPVRPQPYPPFRPRADWDRFLEGLYRKWNGHWEAPHH